MPAVLSKLKLGSDTFTIEDRSVHGDHAYGDPEIWDTIPRGCSRIFVDATEIATLMGVRKFGYKNGEFGPLVPKEDLKMVVLMEKANGENAKMSAFTHEGTHFWLVSSKNVCIVYEVGKLDETLAKIPSMTNSDRYGPVIKIAKIWESMTPVPALHAELAAKKWTLNAEIILDDTDHIVIYTKKNCFKFFAITHDAPSSTGLTAVSPMEAITFFQKHSLDHVECHGPYAYGSSEHLAKLDEITFATDSNGRVLSEGVVSYAMSADECVRLILKHKSILYDLERSGVRHCQQKGELTESDLRSRIEMLAGSDSTHPVVQRWMKTRFPFFLAFTEWLKSETILPLPPKEEKNAWIERLTRLIPTSSASASSTSIGEGPSWMFQARWLKLQKIFEPIYATLPAIREKAYDLFKTATYVAVPIELPCLPVLTASLPEHVKAFLAKYAQREFHITTLFCHKDPSLDQLRLADQLIDHVGKSFSFSITHLLYAVKNDKVMLVTLVVERAGHALPAENQHLHITIACGPGVKPAASNQMAALHVSEDKESLLADNRYGLFRDASIRAITFPYKIFVSGALTPVARASSAASSSSTNSSTSSSTNSSSSSTNSSSSSRASKPKKPYKVIAFRGPSGSGKSTVANELKTFLESLGKTIALFETDTCPDISAAINGLKKSPPQVILITGVGEKKFSSVDRDLEVWFTHSSGYGSEDHVEFLVKRVNTRGEDHPSFTPEKLKGKTSVKVGITSQLKHHPLPTGAFTVDETTETLSVIKNRIDTL